MTEPDGNPPQTAPAPDLTRNTDGWTAGFLEVDRNRLFHWLRRSIQLRVFHQSVPDRQAAILDVGCGGGTFLRLLLAEGYGNVHGIEPNAQLIASFRQALPQYADRVRQGLSHPLPFPDRTFDCIYFFNVLHHLTGETEYRAALAEIDRCLRPHGVVIWVEPCRKWIYTLKRNLARLNSGWSPFFRRMHHNMMEEKELMERFIDHIDWFRDQLRNAGYGIEQDRRVIHQWIHVGRKSGAS